MNAQKGALILGGIGLAGILAYVYLRKKDDSFTPSGGSTYGQSAGYEGGGEGLAFPALGGDTVVFPAPDTGAGLNNLLSAMTAGGNAVPKKETATKDAVNPGPFVKPVYTPVTAAESSVYRQAAAAQGSSRPGTSAAAGAMLDILFAPITTTVGAVKAGAGVISSVTGGRSGRGTLGTPTKATFKAEPVMVIQPKKSSSGGGSVTSAQTGGSSHVANYVQQKYGSNPQLTVRGYSITGVPLYKPK